MSNCRPTGLTRSVLAAVRLLVLLLAVLPAAALAQDAPADDDLVLPDKPGGLDIGDAAAVEERQVRLVRERERAAGDEPRIRALNAQITVLEKISEFLKIVAKDGEDRIARPEDALDRAKVAESKARKALDDLDPVAATADLQRYVDVEKLRQEVEKSYTAPLREAREKTQGLIQLQKRREADLARLPERVKVAQERYALAAARVRELKARMEAGPTGTEAILLRWEFEAAQQSALLERRRIAHLAEQKKVLGPAIEIAKVQVAAAKLGESRLEKLAAAAQAVLKERIAVEKETAQDRIEKMRAALAAATEEHVRIRLRLELENEEMAAKLRRRIEQETSLSKTRSTLEEDLAQAKNDLEGFQTAYEPGAPAEKRPGSERVSELIEQLSNQTELSAYLERRAERENQNRELEAELGEARKAKEGLEEEFAKRLAEAKAAYDAARERLPDGERMAHPWIYEKMGNQRTRLQRSRIVDGWVGVLERLVEHLTQVLDDSKELQDLRRETLLLLRRENLFLRGRTHITWEAFSEGTGDLAKLPAYLASVGGAAATFLFRPGHRDRILTLAGLGLVLLVGALFFRRQSGRWIRTHSGDAAETPASRTRIAVLRLLRSLALALALLGLATAAHLLLGDRLPAGVSRLVLGLGLVFSGFLALRSANRLLIRGYAGARGILHLEEATARRIGGGISVALWISVVLLPIRLALEQLGYPNEGVVEFVALTHQILIGAIAFVVLLRRRLLLGLFPQGSSRFARVVRLLVAILHPIVVLLIPGILLLRVLGYDILAGFIAAVAVRTVAFALLGYLLYRAARLLLDGRLPPESKAGPMLLFTLRISAFLLTAWAILKFSGTNLGELESFFSVPLPFTPEDAARPVTWWSLFAATAVVFLTFAAARHLKVALQEFVLARTKLDRGLQYTIVTLFGYVVIVGGLLAAVRLIIDLSSLAYVVAALSVGIGFGLQEIVSNFISGIILLFERSLKVGDMIRVGDAEGVVTRIQVRSTSVRTQDNVYIIIPNRDFMTQNTVNLAGRDTKLRLRLPVGTSYDSDPEEVKRVLIQVAGSAASVLRYPAPDVFFVGLGDSSLDFELLVWIPNPVEKNRIRSQLYFAIFAALGEAGIEIPFPQRDLHLRSAEPLRLAEAPSSAEGVGQAPEVAEEE